MRTYKLWEMVRDRETGMLQSMVSQRVRHDLVTEQQQQVIKFYLFLAVLGLYCCSGFSLVLESMGFSLAVACSLLIVALLMERGV